MVTTMVVSESLKKAQLVLEKVTAVQEGLVNTLDQISTAVDQNKLVDLASLHSQAPQAMLAKFRTWSLPRARQGPTV